MGTDFDEFSRLSYHGNLEISKNLIRIDFFIRDYD